MRCRNRRCTGNTSPTNAAPAAGASAAVTTAWQPEMQRYDGTKQNLRLSVAAMKQQQCNLQAGTTLAAAQSCRGPTGGLPPTQFL